MDHHVLPVLPVQVDRHVARLLDHRVRHVEEIHCTIVAKLPRLVREVDLQYSITFFSHDNITKMWWLMGSA